MSRTWLDTASGVGYRRKIVISATWRRTTRSFPCYRWPEYCLWTPAISRPRIVNKRVDEMVELFQLRGWSSQTQRTIRWTTITAALARAVAPSAAYWMLDEPLSALDAPTRVHL